MMKYKRIALQHWQLLYNHEDNKKRKMAGALLFIYQSRLASSLGTLDNFYGRKVPKKQVQKTQQARQVALMMQE